MTDLTKEEIDSIDTELTKEEIDEFRKELQEDYKNGIIYGFEHPDDKWALMNMLLTIGEMSVYDFMDFEEEIRNEQTNCRQGTF